MASKDVEMKPVEETITKEEKKETPPPPKPTPVQEIKANVALIERGVASMEPRFTHRVLRTLGALRKTLTPEVLKEAIEANVNDSGVKKTLLGFVDIQAVKNTMDIDTSTPVHPRTGTHTPAPGSTDIPEKEMYFRLLIIHYLLSAQSTTVRSNALSLAKQSTAIIQSLNRRTMDPIAAKVWWAYGRAYEVIPKLDLAELRPSLLAAQRTAALRRDDDTQAVLINWILRNYLHYNLFSQADKFVSKTSFPQSAGNPQLARNHFYLGRIRAVQLSYSEAHAQLQQAIRRAPPAITAPGFYQTVHKFFVIVELLMGEIPERATFRHQVLEKPLEPYFEIVQAVRAGSLAQFQTAVSRWTAQFAADNTLTLISRLRQNVIKTGIRKLSLAYSRISLRDICLKLNLDSEEDAEYIVGKSIKDGVIDSVIVHEKGWMVARGYEGEKGTEGQNLNLSGIVKGYGPEVVDIFGKRIAFCLQLHNESVRAMRYPLNAHRKELNNVQAVLEREKELSKEVMRGEHDDDDDDSPGPLGDL